MAYLHRRGKRIEIRESVATPRGPRSRVLASFSGSLTPDVLAEAARKASRPFDAVALARRARERGIEVASVAREPEARALLARFEEKRGHQDSLGALLQLLTLVDQPCPRQLEIMVSRVTLFIAADGRVSDGQRVQLVSLLQRVRDAGAVSLPAMQSLLRLSRQLPV